MASIVSTPPKVHLPVEVEAFAEQKGLSPFLPRLVAAFERLFAGATRLNVQLHEDPEVRDLTWLVFRAEGPWQGYEEERQLRKAWYLESAAICPNHLLTDFALHLYTRPR